MSHKVIIRIEAEVDITDAAIWYERQKDKLGHEFLAEIEAAIARAAENPFHFPCFRRRPEVRRVLMTGSHIVFSSFGERIPSLCFGSCTGLATTASGNRTFPRIEMIAR